MLDVLIIGAGFAGAATAYFLSSVSHFGAPLKIAVLEKEPSAGKYASGRNAGMFRQAVCPFEVARCIQRTKFHWKKWNHSPKALPWFRETGSFLLGKSQEIILLQQALTQAGGISEVFLKGEFPKQIDAELVGLLKVSPYEALLFTPDDGVINTQAYLQDLLERSKQQGVEITFGQSVEKLTWCEDHWQVQHTSDLRKAKIIVNAAGAWANPIAEAAGLKGLEMISYRRHLFNYAPSQQLQKLTSWPIVWNVNQEIYLRPLGEKFLFSPGDETPHPAQDPEVDPQVEELLQQKIRKNFPSLKLSSSYETLWACLRTKTVGDAMILGPDLANRHFIWAAALGGHGLSASLGVGEKVSHFCKQLLEIKDENKH